MALRYQIIYWRDIPAQIKVKAGRTRTGRPLSNRFIVAIDEAAMRAGVTDADDYLAQWRNGEWQEREGEMDEVASALVTEVESNYPKERIRQLVRQHGYERTGE